MTAFGLSDLASEAEAEAVYGQSISPAKLKSIGWSG